MHGPEKGHYRNECLFTHIEPKLIRWTRVSQPLFDVLFVFEPVDENHTKIVFRMIFDTAEESEKIRRFAVEKNEENFDRLEAELERMENELRVT